jgi:membrane protein required for colicin V production
MRPSEFNVFDWFLAILILSSMVMAFRRGLVRAIFGLLGFVGGFLRATWTYDSVGDWISMSRLHLSLATSRILGFLLVVVAVVVALEFTGRLIQRLLRTVGLGWFDRLLGAAFGFARGCMIGIAVLMVTSLVAPQSSLLTDSVLAPYLFAASHDVSFLVPQYLQNLMLVGSFDLKHEQPHWINSH